MTTRVSQNWDEAAPTPAHVVRLYLALAAGDADAALAMAVEDLVAEQRRSGPLARPTRRRSRVDHA